MGIITEYSKYWLIVIAIASFGLTYYFYKDQHWINAFSKKLKVTLFSLRFIGLFFCLLLLLGLFLESIQYRDEKPLLITIIDNSSSMKNYSDSSKLKSSVSNFKNNVTESVKDKMELVNYTIGERFNPAEKFNFKEKESHLSLAFDELSSLYYNRNIGAIVLVSDGNYTKGTHPRYTAQNIPFAPIYTIGIGDTLDKKDQSISNITANEFAFLNSKFPIEVEIASSKLTGKSTTAILTNNGKKIASKPVQLSNESIQKIRFEVNASEIGMQQYSVVLAPLKEEYTTKNNQQTIYIEILDNRNKILLLAGAPHPDVTALKSVLEKDENIQAEVAYANDFKKSIASYDLIIWHEPGINFNSKINSEIETNNKSVFYFIGNSTPNSIIQQLNLGFTPPNTNSSDEAQAAVASATTLFELSDNTTKKIPYLPPVSVRFGDLFIPSFYQTILYQKIGGIVKKDPLLFLGEVNSRKTGVFYGEGIWKWKLHEYSETKNNATFNELFQKVYTYLLVKQNTSALRILLPKKITKGSNTEVKAEFYNSSMQAITTPLINFEIINSKQKKNKFQFSVANSHYQLSLGTLSPGSYNWTASTSHGGKNYIKKGTLFVEDIEMEKQFIKSDYSTLRAISAQSKGKFFTLSNSNKIIEELSKRKDIATVSFEEKEALSILDYILPLILICLVFGAEWFIKKWNGQY